MRDYSRLDTTVFARTRVAGLRVLVAGAGALGNEVIKNLALIGVGHLGILDRDSIEASNLTRSVLFCTPEIETDMAKGTPKAELAARRAREINPDVRVAAHVCEAADFGSGALRQADVVFSCFDNEMARLELSWVCSRLNKPLVDGGLGLINPSTGMVSLFPGSEGPCYACRKGGERRRMLLQDLQGREDPCGVKERLQREAAAIPTTPTMSSIVGALQVEAGIRHVLGRGEEAVAPHIGLSHRITLHPRMHVESSTFERSPNCPLHQTESLIRDVEQRRDRVSREWTAAQLLHETGGGAAFLNFDWPMTAHALCRGCRHEWEPLTRRARFRGQRCPACDGDDLVETEVLTGVGVDTSWASRSLTALGLPAGHIHEVISSSGDRRHVEVTGDLVDEKVNLSCC